MKDNVIIKDKEKSESKLLDILLDPNNTDSLEMVSERGEVVRFSQVAIIPHTDTQTNKLALYVILAPIDKVEGLAEDEALVFEVTEVDDDYCLCVVNDEEIVNLVFSEYYKLLDETIKKNNRRD